jgi:hypothetical protein
MSSAQTHSAYSRRRDDGSLLNQFTLSAHSWSRWVNEQAVADYAKCATSVKIRWTKPERSGERLAVAPSRHDRCHGWPNGVVLAIDEFGGSKDKLSTGVCPAAGVKKTSTK